MLGFNPNWRKRPDIRRQRETLRSWLPIHQLRGLEMGPLDKPLVEPAEGFVRYVDQFPVDELKRRCAANPNRDADAVVEPHFVLMERPILEVVTERFDYIVASHVAEHVPNLLGWLRDLAQLTGPRAWLYLVMPDRRYCFDVDRPATTVGELVENDMVNRQRPGIASAFDQRYYHRQVSSHSIWNGQPPTAVPRTFDAQQAMALAQRAASSYVDCHCNVFEPGSFRECIEVAASLGLQPFRCSELRETEKPFLDFIVLLEKYEAQLEECT